MGIDAEMFVRIKYKPTAAQLADWHYRLGCAFHNHLWIFGAHDNKTPEDLFLFQVQTWEQDGDDIIPEAGEIFLRLRPKSRYYGVGYERGDFPTLRAIAEFIELMIPQSEVWYGGDSSGILAERFGPAERESLFRHFVEYQHSPYQNAFSGVNCPECPYCHRTTAQFGFGQGYASCTCLGCGWNYINKNGAIEAGWNLKEV